MTVRYSLLILAAICSCLSCLKVESYANGLGSWRVIERFGVANPTFRFSLKHNYSDHFALLLYSESIKSMTHISDLSREFDCVDRENFAVFNIDVSAGSESLSVSDSNFKYIYKEEIDGQDIFEDGTWVFIVLTHCGNRILNDNIRNNGDIFAEIDLEMTNEVLGRTVEYSYDEFGLYSMTLFAFGTQTMLVIVSFVIQQMLHRLKRDHHTVTMLVFATAVRWLSECLWLGYMTSYQSNGVRRLSVFIGATFFQFLAIGITVLLLLVLAGGWTIVRRKIPIIGRIRISVFLVLYLTLIIASCCWYSVTFGPLTSSTFYFTAPCIMLSVFHVVLAARFKHIAQHTVTKFQLKKRFYKKFSSSYTVWILYIPLCSLISVSLDPMQAQATIFIIEKIAWIVGNIGLLILYHPVLGTKWGTFPFHARCDEMSTANASRIQTMSVGISGGMDSIVDVSGRIRPRDAFDMIYLTKIRKLVVSLVDLSHKIHSDASSLLACLSKVAIGNDNESQSEKTSLQRYQMRSSPGKVFQFEDDRDLRHKQDKGLVSTLDSIIERNQSTSL